MIATSWVGFNDCSSTCPSGVRAVLRWPEHSLPRASGSSGAAVLLPTTTSKWAGTKERAVLALQELRYIAGQRGDPVMSMTLVPDRCAPAAATSSNHQPGLAKAAGGSPGGHSGHIWWPLHPWCLSMRHAGESDRAELVVDESARLQLHYSTVLDGTTEKCAGGSSWKHYHAATSTPRWPSRPCGRTQGHLHGHV